MILLLLRLLVNMSKPIIAGVINETKSVRVNANRFFIDKSPFLFNLGGQYLCHH